MRLAIDFALYFFLMATSVFGRDHAGTAAQHAEMWSVGH